MLAAYPDLVRREKIADFRPATYAMERDYAYLRADYPAGFGWMTQDLHASGAVGDASLATRREGRGGARPWRARLRGAARRCGEIRSGGSRGRSARIRLGGGGKPQSGGTHEHGRYRERREDKRLNNLVAVTVVILTVFMAITKVKDDNINQAMQKAKANSVDAWAEYQFARVKLHVDENGLNQLRLLETTGQIEQGARRQAGGRIRGRHQEIRRPLEGDARQGRAARGRVRPAEFPRRPVRHVGRVPVDRGRGLGGGGAGRQLSRCSTSPGRAARWGCSSGPPASSG